MIFGNFQVSNEKFYDIPDGHLERRGSVVARLYEFALVHAPKWKLRDFAIKTNICYFYLYGIFYL
jgi:hypothetical protein